MPVLGVPSTEGELVYAFGSQRGYAGADGEQRTATVLDRAFRNDQLTWILHDLNTPGYDYANIDHVALRRTADGTLRIMVIDSKLWLPGKYRPDADGVLLRDGDKFAAGKSALGLADMANALTRAIGEPDVQTKLCLAVWPSRTGVINMGFAKKRLQLNRGISLVRGRDIVRTIDDGLGQGARPMDEAVEKLRPYVRKAS